MVEISNSSITALVLVTLVVAAAGTYVAFVNSPRASFFFPFTGHATSGSGNVTLTINQTLAIEVDAGFNLIDFGTCNPRAGTSYWCATNDTMGCDGVNVNNCTGDATSNASQYIRVNNVGNVDANVNLSSTCDASTLIGGTSPLLQYVTTHCNGTAVGSWTSLVASGNQAGCTNVSYQGGAMRFYVNVTIPQNAVGRNGACVVNQTTITFTGSNA